MKVLRIETLVGELSLAVATFSTSWLSFFIIDFFSRNSAIFLAVAPPLANEASGFVFFRGLESFERIASGDYSISSLAYCSSLESDELNLLVFRSKTTKSFNSLVSSRIPPNM
jgi:hypothetical protein